MTLDNLAGTDPAGCAGLEDEVDWHWERIFAGAALTTLLGIGAELAALETRRAVMASSSRDVPACRRA